MGSAPTAESNSRQGKVDETGWVSECKTAGRMDGEGIKSQGGGAKLSSLTKVRSTPEDLQKYWTEQPDTLVVSPRK